MEKIRLGKTGMMVTRLGFGGIPIQRLTEAEAVKVIQKCVDLGINYIDTANGYTTSEERIGKAVKGRRQDVIIATKTFPGTAEDVTKNLDLSLKRLQTDYIDLYQFHGVNSETLKHVLDPENGIYKVFEGFKKAGKIRHIGITAHQMDAAKEQIKTDKFETIMFPFNVITSEPAKELLPLCRKHDVGFIVMKPLAGGMLNNARIAFKYLLQFPDVVSIPGIEKASEIEEIYSFYENPEKMTAAEEAEMQQMIKELGNRFCRRCEYCQPCQQGIPISLIMTFDTFVKRMPVARYMNNPMIADSVEKAKDCIECGECETRCPFQLPIREILKKNYGLYEQIKAANA